MSAGLVEWLRAQLDEDAEYAQQVIDADHAEYSANWTLHVSSVIDVGEGLEGALAVGDRVLAHHIVQWDPARVLAEVAAKRAILDLWSEGAEFPDFDGGYQTAIDEVVARMASVYRGRAGWRDEWEADL